MTPTDTGPLVALFNRRDANHARCWATMPSLPKPLVTTWPCLTEAGYQLYKAGQWFLVNSLWEFIDRGMLVVHMPTSEELARVLDIMRQYHDLPSDLADASLIAAAESRNLRRIFTLDGHFYAYRLLDGTAFEVLP